MLKLKRNQRYAVRNILTNNICGGKLFRTQWGVLRYGRMLYREYTSLAGLFEIVIVTLAD